MPPIAEDNNRSLREEIPNMGMHIQRNRILNGKTYLIRHALRTPVINCPGFCIGVMWYIQAALYLLLWVIR